METLLDIVIFLACFISLLCCFISLLCCGTLLILQSVPRPFNFRKTREYRKYCVDCHNSDTMKCFDCKHHSAYLICGSHKEFSSKEK